MSNNHRFQPISGDVSAETLSPRIEIDWDPETEEGVVRFQTVRYLNIAGQITEPMDQRRGTFSVSLSDLMDVTPLPQGATDPGNGVFIDGLSGSGVMLFIKAAFDQLFNQAVEEANSA